MNNGALNAHDRLMVNVGVWWTILVVVGESLCLRKLEKVVCWIALVFAS